MPAPSYIARRSGSAAIVVALVGASMVLLGVACKPQPGPSNLAADSALARDLALAKADSAAQPRLADTAANATTPIAPPPPAAVPAPVTPKHDPAHARAVSRRKSPDHSPTPSGNSAASASAPVVAAAPVAPAPPPPPPPLVAASGTSVDIVAADTVSTAQAHVGDLVYATTATDVKDASGAVVVPAGSRLHGTVTTSSGPAHTPHLAVSFTSVDVGGNSYPVQATVTSLPLVQARRTARVAQAGEVGGGAVAGGLLGRLIGGKKSGGTLIGAVAGAAAGAVVADKTESHDAVLPKGAHITLQLTSAVTVAQH